MDLSSWENIVNQIASDLYNGNTSVTDLNKKYILKTAAEFDKAIDEGFPNPSEDDIQVVLDLKQNAWMFSAAKNVAMQHEIAELITDNSGAIRSFNDFKKDVLKLNKNYNLNYLQAEYQTALASSQSAKKWQDIQRRKKRYPNLEYRTIGDERVREQHQALHGIIRPVDHSFWNTYYPPNGWRCRCYVVQTNKATNGDEVPVVDQKTVPDSFRRNVVLDGGVFNTDMKAGSNSFMLYGTFIPPIPKKVQKQILNSFDKLKQFIPYYKAKTFKNGSKVFVHPFADKTDLFGNYRAALKIAKSEKNTTIKIRVHLLDKKNPEIEINGVIYDRKQITSNQRFYNAFDDAFDQGAKSVVFDLSAFPKWDYFEAWRKMKGKLLHYKNERTVYLTYKDVALKLNSKEIINGKALQKLKKLKGD